MKAIIVSICIISISLLLSEASNRWPNHDISTLKLLQIVHRHGDRAPITFSKNDPYKDEKYWPEGFGNLIAKGKYRMYKYGEYIRNEYNDYLGDKYSPREVYARSALTDRCLESVSCLLSGAYPPKQHDWQWNNGTDAPLGKNWQPFPIQSFMPENEDVVLAQSKQCLAVNKEMQRIYNKTVFKDFLKQSMEFYNNVSKVVGQKIDTIEKAQILHAALQIEMDHNYYWTKYWTKEEQKHIVDQLSKSDLIDSQNGGDSPIIKRLRAGGLVRELNNNFQNVLNKENKKKLYVYSTHGEQVAVLLEALDITTGESMPFGVTLLFELHQKKNSAQNEGYFVRLYYKNDTDIKTNNPHSIRWTDCGNQFDCPFNQYVNSTKHLLYTDINKECNQ